MTTASTSQNPAGGSPLVRGVGPHATVQPRLTVRLVAFPESNGKRNWTAMILRADEKGWGGLLSNCGGVTVAHGELWNRVAYEAERAKLLIGERDTEPHILDYGDDIKTPDEWAGEVRGGHPVTDAPRRHNAKLTGPSAGHGGTDEH